MVVFVCVGDGWVGSIVSKMAIILSLTHSSAVRVAYCVVGLVVI